MRKRTFYLVISLAFLVIISSCADKKKEKMFTGAKNEVKLITLNPGHFHATLIQKLMYEQVDPVVHVYAPAGPEVEDHLKRIEGFNTRADNPTSWMQEVYYGDDFLEKSLAEKAGNVMITAGNNANKTEYILKFIEAGINVLADKPMVTTSEKFPMLLQAFEAAERNNVLLYDIMTERFEITTIIQRELSLIDDAFGGLIDGTPEEPAITKESVHHFFKYIAGNPIKRPAWYLDVEQQGEGIVDVTTHLVDLIQWTVFPGQIIDYKSDIEMIAARRWQTALTPQQFEKVTQLKEYPDFLKKYVNGDTLKVYANGEIIYKLRDKYAKALVIWNFEAPEGTGDTHYSIMRGNKSDLVIQQGIEENFKPILYVFAKETEKPDDFALNLQKAINTVGETYPGIELVQLGEGKWKVEIPEKYKVGHEAHFAQVTERYLQYLQDGALPEWEVPNMIAKYYTNLKALEMAKK